MLLLLLAAALAHGQVHVSPKGSDEGNGSYTSPFKTVQRAQVSFAIWVIYNA